MEIKPGQIWHHFKDNDYVIVAIGRHTETDEEMVVYHHLDDSEHVRIRPKEMFLEEVDRPEYNYKGLRFVLKQ